VEHPVTHGDGRAATMLFCQEKNMISAPSALLLPAPETGSPPRATARRRPQIRRFHSVMARSWREKTAIVLRLLSFRKTIR